MARQAEAAQTDATARRSSVARARRLRMTAITRHSVALAAGAVVAGARRHGGACRAESTAAQLAEEGVRRQRLAGLRRLVRQPRRHAHVPDRLLQPQLDAEDRHPDRPEQPLRAGRPRPRPADTLPARPRLRHVHDHGAEGQPATEKLWWVLTVNGVTSTCRSHRAPTTTSRRSRRRRKGPGGKYNTPPVLRFCRERRRRFRTRSPAWPTRSSGRPRPACRCRSTSGSRTTRSMRAARTRRSSERRAIVELVVAKYRGPGMVTVATDHQRRRPQGRQARRAVRGQGLDDRDLQRTRRLPAARHRQRPVGAGRRRHGLLLDDRAW